MVISEGPDDSDPSSFLDLSCNYDSDCQNEQCIEKKEVTVCDGITCGTEDQCVEQASPYDKGFKVCSSYNQCVQCVSDVDCGDTYTNHDYCINNKCVQCTKDEDCEGDKVCTENFCSVQNINGDIGDECNKNEECKSNLCNEGNCALKFEGFSFAVISDTHNFNRCNPEQGKWVTEAIGLINSKNPSFVVGVGDLVSGGSNCPSGKGFTEQLANFKEVFLEPLNVPFVPVGGNHDLNGGVREEWKKFWFDNQNKLLSNILMSDFPESYRFTYEGIGFSIIDYYDTWGLKQEELDWVEAEVEPEDLVFRHVNPYGVACFKSGGCGFSISHNHKKPNQLTDLLISKSAKAIFSGHNHAFYDGICDGLRFVNTGTLGKRVVGYVQGLDQIYATQSFVWVDIMDNGEMKVSFYYYDKSQNSFKLFDKSNFPKEIKTKITKYKGKNQGIAAICKSIGVNALSPDQPEEKSPVPISKGTPTTTITSSTSVSQKSCPSRPNQNCQNNERCKLIDEAWLNVGPLIGGPLSNKIFDTGINNIESFNNTYCVEKVKPKISSETQPPPATISASQTEVSGCKITSGIDSKSVGSGSKGSLINGVKTKTNSFKSSYNRRYSIATDSMEKVEYGNLELIQMLELTSCVLEKKYNVKLTVKDRSLPKGGITYKSKSKYQEMPPNDWFSLSGDDKYKYSGHWSHQNGVDADLGYFFVDSGELKNTLTRKGCGKKTCTGPASAAFIDPLALAANWDQLKAMEQSFPLSGVMFDKYLIYEMHKFACDKEGESSLVEKFFKDCDLSYTVGNKKRWGLIDHLNGHADHYHIRIKCPKGDDQCKGTKTSRKVSLPVIS